MSWVAYQEMIETFSRVHSAIDTTKANATSCVIFAMDPTRLRLNTALSPCPKAGHISSLSGRPGFGDAKFLATSDSPLTSSDHNTATHHPCPLRVPAGLPDYMSDGLSEGIRKFGSSQRHVINTRPSNRRYG